MPIRIAAVFDLRVTEDTAFGFLDTIRRMIDDIDVVMLVGNTLGPNTTYTVGSTFFRDLSTLGLPVAVATGVDDVAWCAAHRDMLTAQHGWNPNRPVNPRRDWVYAWNATRFPALYFNDYDFTFNKGTDLNASIRIELGGKQTTIYRDDPPVGSDGIHLSQITSAGILTRLEIL